MEPNQQGERSSLMRLDVYPERQSLPLPTADETISYPLLDQVSGYCGWPKEGLILEKEADLLVDLVIQAFTGPGERIAVFEPGSESYKSSVLSVEAAYVDCGRTHDWSPRIDALDMVFSDGAVGVVLGSPNHPVDSTSNMTLKVIQAAGNAPSVLFALIDASQGLLAPQSLLREIPEAIYLMPFWLSSGEGFYALLCDRERADIMARLRGSYLGGLEGDLLESENARLLHEEMSVRQKGLLTQLADSGYRVVPSGRDGAFVTAPGTDQKALSDGLEALGYQTEYIQHHTWRGGIRVLSAGGETP